MAIDAREYADDEQCEGCEAHARGLRLVTALFAHLYVLEERLDALEERERQRDRPRAA
jgi:hypothetical protein